MARSYFLPHIEQLAGYEPGEQPREAGFIKLNTNENPYSPSPRVAQAIGTGLNGRARLYPDPLGTAFRQAAARLYGVEPDMVLAGNGSDDLLTIVTRAFAGPGHVVVYPTPSYVLYRTLAELQGARPFEVPFQPDWSLKVREFAPARARLAFLANPNSPSGTALSPRRVAALARALPCPLVVDEAYTEFAETSCIELLSECPNLIITRTLSKAYGLAGLRFGYLIARPEVVTGLIKVKDSYNCDALSLLGAEAALADQDHLAQTRSKILATRQRLTDELRALGYTVPDSQANFVWCTGDRDRPVRKTYERLAAQKILVRYMKYPDIAEGLRISVGTDAEIDALLEAMRAIG